MNTSILPLSLFAVILLSGLQADAQCRRFSKQRVLGALEADMVLDRITAGAIGRGETAATLMPIHDSGDIELLISTHPDLGRVTFRILDVEGRQIREGELLGSTARIPVQVEAGIDLIVHIESEQAVGAYTPLGCVAISTARERNATASIPNEMDILTGE